MGKNIYVSIKSLIAGAAAGIMRCMLTTSCCILTESKYDNALSLKLLCKQLHFQL